MIAVCFVLLILAVCLLGSALEHHTTGVFTDLLPTDEDDLHDDDY
jgi:hypothetical protein